MKQDVRTIKNEILDQKKEREQTQKTKKLKQLCKALCFSTIQENLKYNVSLETLYLQRDEIINEMLKDINKQTILIEDVTTFKPKINEIKIFDFPDFQIKNILFQMFDLEFSKEEKRQKKEYNILKKELKERLKNKFIYEIANINSLKYATITILYYEHNKKDIINEISKNEKEKDIISEIYVNVLNEVKKMYSEQIKTEKQILKTQSSKKLHWTWKGYFALKAFNTIRKKGF